MCVCVCVCGCVSDTLVTVQWNEDTNTETDKNIAVNYEMSGCGLSCCSRNKYAWRNRLLETRSVATVVSHTPAILPQPARSFTGLFW